MTVHSWQEFVEVRRLDPDRARMLLDAGHVRVTSLELGAIAKTDKALARELMQSGSVVLKHEEARRDGDEESFTAAARRAAQAGNGLPPHVDTPENRQFVADRSKEIRDRKAAEAEAEADRVAAKREAAATRITERQLGVTQGEASQVREWSSMQFMSGAEFRQFAKVDAQAAREWQSKGGTVALKHLQ